VLPRLNEAVNEEWISDKTRFIWDGLRTQRLDRPYVRENGRLRAATWAEAFAAIKAKLVSTTGAKIGAIGGDLASVEELYALKALVSSLGSSNLDARQDGTKLHPKFGRASYTFNAGVAGIEQTDAILIVGSDPRHEAAVLNARIRKAWRQSGGKLPIFVIGQPLDLTYPYTYLGAGAETLANLEASVADKLNAAQKPLVIVGQGPLLRHDGEAILSLAAKVAVEIGAVKDDWNGFAVLHTAASRVGGLDVGFVPGAGGLDVAGMIDASAKGNLDLLFLLGADEFGAQHLGEKTFVVYIGSHGDTGAHRADVILPGAAYTEKSGTYVNTEGRVQMTNRAVFAPGEAREDWAVLRALSDVLGKKLPFDSLTQLRAKLYAELPYLAALDEAPVNDIEAVAKLASVGGVVRSEPFDLAVGDFYLTNPIARASKIMAECSALAASTHEAAAE
jgi:NADH-quinone oxidoreductase subunit G